MIRIQVQKVSIRDLDGYDEVFKRSLMPHVIKRAASVLEIGIIHRPLVRQRDLKLICGFDRLGACLAAGKLDEFVDMVDCDDIELERIRLHENVSRRHEPGEQAAGLLALVQAHEEAALIERASEPVEPRKGKGKDKTAKGVARERVAKEVGIKPESVRRAEHRALAKVEKESKAPKAKFPTLGRPVPDTWLAGVEISERCLVDARNKVNQALACVTQLKKSETPYPTGQLQKLYENIQECANYIKDCTPLSVCPWCKMIPEVTAHCTSCRSTGFVTVRLKTSIPPELARADNPMVSWNGAYVPVSEWAPADVVVAPDIEEPSDEELDEAADDGMGLEL